MDSKLGRTRVATMRPPLTSTLFPLGELSLHQLHTPSDGDMFVTADVAVTVFGETRLCLRISSVPIGTNA